MPLTFEEADKLFNSDLCLLASRDIQCRLAALRQQALFSDAPDVCSNPNNCLSRNIWISWNTLRGLPQSEAQIRFVFGVERVCLSLLEQGSQQQGLPAISVTPWDSWDTRRKSRGTNASAALWGGLPGMMPRKNFRQSLCALAIIILVSTSDQSCRFVLDTATPPGVTDQWYGWLAGPVFTGINSISGVLITGYADSDGKAHRVSRVAIGLAIWSCATFLTAFSVTLYGVVGMRILSAMAMATCNPFCTSIIADLFVEERRGLALGVYGLGVYLGYGLALGPYSLIASLFGWRYAYGTAGILGFLILVALISFVPEPIRGACDTFFRNSHDPRSSNWCQYCIGGEEGHHAVRGILKPGTQLIFTHNTLLEKEGAPTLKITISPDTPVRKKRTIVSRFLSSDPNDFEFKNEDVEKKKESLGSEYASDRFRSDSAQVPSGQESKLASPLRPPSSSRQVSFGATVPSQNTEQTSGKSLGPPVPHVRPKISTLSSSENLRQLLLKDIIASPPTRPKYIIDGKVRAGTRATLIHILPKNYAKIKLPGVQGEFRTQLHLLKRPLPKSQLTKGASAFEALRMWITSPSLILMGISGGILNTVGLVLANFIHTRKGGFFGENGFRKVSETALLLGFSWMPLVGGCIGAIIGGTASDMTRGSSGRLVFLAGVLAISGPLAISVLYLPVPWAFLGFLLQQITGEMWPGILMASIVDLSPPRLRARIVSQHYLLTANIGGLGVLATSYLTSSGALDLQKALVIFYPGFLTVGFVLILICARLAYNESMDTKEVPEATDETNVSKESSLSSMPIPNASRFFSRGNSAREPSGVLVDEDENTYGVSPVTRYYGSFSETASYKSKPAANN
mmetsp:Transcript_26272/g.36609  ORF Transcript_26272/g.36609 Transcript_26272/m.36609 type:complete len:856 (+) Transcript_26272:71-2638(+)